MRLIYKAATVLTLAAISLMADDNCNSCGAQALKLPAAPVGAELIYGPALLQYDIYFHVTISGLPAGYSVANGVYHGWCVDAWANSLYGTNPVQLYSTYGTMPAGDQSPNWDKVNWLLNHKKGSAMLDVQVAIWRLLGQRVPPENTDTPAAEALLASALKYGHGFVPGEGQSTAVLVSVGGIGDPAIDPTNQHQTTIIEVICPLSQGYWKEHASAWPLTTINLGAAGSFNTADRSAMANLLCILNTPVRGDENIGLEHQLIAAQLNIAAGVNPAPLANAIADSIGMLRPAKVNSSSALGQLMTGNEAILQTFNEGSAHRSEGDNR